MFLVIHSHAKTTHETADEIPGAKKITEQIYLVHGNALLPFHLQINYNDASFHLQNHLSTLLFPIVDEGKNQILSIVSNRNLNFWRIIVHLTQKV